MEKIISEAKPSKNSVIMSVLKSIQSLMNDDVKIYDVLKKDHRKVEGLFERIESENKADRKLELIGELGVELIAHAETEEKVFYQDFLKKEPNDEVALEAQEEHNVIKNLLKEISTFNDATPLLDAKVKVLKEIVQHHVKEEETEFFAKARQEYDSEQELELGQKFLKAKEKYLKGTENLVKN